MKTTQEIHEMIKNKNKTLFILCGLPYSGKSYLSKEIIKNIPIEYISIDDIFHARGYDWNTNTLPDAKSWSEIFETSYEKTREALNNSKNVLYDSTNHTKTSRDTLRKVAESVGADTHVIFIDVPLDTIYKRWEENKANPTRSVVDRELVDMTIQMFEKPDEDESVISYSIIK